MDIFVKFCGGCNCQIDRAKVVEDIERLLPSGSRLSVVLKDDPADVGLLVCGCPSACAWKPEMAGLADRWVVIGGETVDGRNVLEDQIARAVVEKITK